jgi:hypothetical protein
MLVCAWIEEMLLDAPGDAAELLALLQHAYGALAMLPLAALVDAAQVRAVSAQLPKKVADLFAQRVDLT